MLYRYRYYQLRYRYATGTLPISHTGYNRSVLRWLPRRRPIPSTLSQASVQGALMHTGQGAVAVGVPVNSNDPPLYGANAGVSNPAPAAFAQPAPDVAQGMALLANKHSYPQGLLRSMLASVQGFPLRIWVVDNSGSMNSSGGSRIVKSGNNVNLRDQYDCC